MSRAQSVAKPGLASPSRAHQEPSQSVAPTPKFAATRRATTWRLFDANADVTHQRMDAAFATRAKLHARTERSRPVTQVAPSSRPQPVPSVASSHNLDVARST